MKHVAWAIVLLGCLRALLLVTHAPVVGYANQFDMLRTSACIGLWPATQQARHLATPAAPEPRYRSGEKDSENCLPSTAVLLPGLVAVVADAVGAQSIDLRWIGFSRLLLLFAVALTLQWALRGHPRAALIHALIFTLLICDPVVLLYANSLYTEFTASLGLYMALGSLLVGGVLRQWPRWLMLLWLPGLVLLGGSRIQHLLLPAVLLIPAAIAFGRSHPRLWIVSAIVALLVIGGQLGAMRLNENIGDANTINTVFYSVLPAHPEPVELARGLGLAPQCAQLAHTSWYLTREQDHRAICPAAFELSRVRLLMVLASNPTTFLTLALRAVHYSGAWRMPYVGEVSGGSFQQFEGVSGASLAGLVAALPFALYALLYGLALLLGLLAGWLAWRRAPGMAGASLLTGSFALSLVMLVVFAAALFGDGFSEFARHAQLSNLSFAALLLILPLGLVRHSRAGRPLKLAVGITAVALVVLIALGTRLLPLSSGVLEQPASLGIQAGTTQVSGWAADPLGVSEVWLEFDRADQQYDRVRLEFTAADDVSRYLPVGGEGVRFASLVTLPARPARQEVRIVVVSQAGTKTVIDRRYFD